MTEAPFLAVMAPLITFSNRLFRITSRTAWWLHIWRRLTVILRSLGFTRLAHWLFGLTLAPGNGNAGAFPIFRSSIFVLLPCVRISKAGALAALCS